MRRRSDRADRDQGRHDQAGRGLIADGRAKAIRADCEASLTALDGLGIDLYLIHAPDPRTPWRTSVRALARLVDDGLAPHVGLSNVNRAQLDEALALAPISAVEVALSVGDDRAVRGGIVERCAELGIAVIAHSPLGGPRRRGARGRQQALAAVAAAHEASAAEIALAWLLELSPVVVAIPGARRPETARSAARAARIALSDDERRTLARALAPERVDAGRLTAAAGVADDAEVVVVMGIPGAGKTRVAAEYAARGYLRLNRDERGGGLREIAAALDDELAGGARRVVLDNTYLTRPARSYVLESAARHGVPVRCVWLDTPLAQAQVNLVERLLKRFGALPTPEELRALARREPGALTPTSQMRTFRELEPPADDEGFTAVERTPFVRATADERTRAGVFVAATALLEAGWERSIADGDPAAPHLVYDWKPEGDATETEPLVALVRDRVSGPVAGAVCPDGAGPPSCWCRPPLPGLPLAFARAHAVDVGRSMLVGSRPAHRTLATTLGARYVPVG